VLDQLSKKDDFALKRDATFTIGTRFILLILQAIWAVLIARLLGPEARGEFGLLITVPTLVALFLDFGIGTSNAYLIAQRKVAPAEIVENSLFLTLVLGATIYLLFWCLAPFISSTFLNNENQLYFRIVIAGIPFILAFRYFIGVLQGEKRFLIYNASHLLTPSILVILFLSLHRIFHFGVPDALTAWVVAWLITSIFAVYHVTKKTKFKLNLHFEVLTKSLRFSYKVYLAEIVSLLNYRITFLIVGYFCSIKVLQSKDPGYFVVAITVAEALWAIATSVQVVILPRFVQSSKERMADLVPRAVRNVLFLTSIGIFTLRLLDPLLIPFVFGYDYLPTLEPLHILYIGILVAGGSKILGTYFLGIGQPEINAYFNFAGLISNLLACWLLIPVFGLAGAALSVSIGYLVVSLLQTVTYLRESGVSLRRLILLDKSDILFYFALINKHIVRLSS